MKKTSTLIVILTTALVLTAGQTIDECLKQDSISCVQKSLYKSAKEFFGKDQLELLSGISLVRSKDDVRNSRSGKDLAYDQEMDVANSVMERQNALENFISDEAGQFLTGRSLRINLESTFEKINESARSFSESLPPEIRQAVDEVVEGRKKKMKGILPLLIAAKVKLGLLATLTYFVTGLLAKKAILASLISLAISAFIGIKSLWGGKGSHDITSYSNGWAAPINGGWSGGAGWNSPAISGGWSNGGWDDSHAYAHGQAYSGYHH